MHADMHTRSRLQSISFDVCLTSERTRLKCCEQTRHIGTRPGNNAGSAQRSIRRSTAQKRQVQNNSRVPRRVYRRYFNRQQRQGSVAHAAHIEGSGGAGGGGGIGAPGSGGIGAPGSGGIGAPGSGGIASAGIGAGGIGAIGPGKAGAAGITP